MNYSLCGDFLNSNKILYPMLEYGIDYINGKRDFLPWAVEIHPTAKCNHRCIHCSYKERNENRAELSKEIFQKLIADIISMKIKGVYFSGGGEPCIYPHLAYGIEKLTDNGIEVALISNGSLIAESGILNLADKINYIAVSVPSCDSRNFAKITGKQYVDRILSVPEEIKALHGDNSPIVGARIVVTNLIAEEVPDIFVTLRKKDFDYALFKIVRDYESRGLGLSDEAVERLRDAIEDLRAEIDPSFTNLDKIFDYRKPYMPSSACHINQMGMLAVVTPDGDVYPNIAEIGDNSFLIGNIEENSFRDLWNSDSHKNVKCYSDDQWSQGKCQNCRAIRYNEIITTMIESMPGEMDPFV